MAKKITGFKVFLWSMLGTVAGAFVLGAFANITRDDEKKETPTEITLETFQDDNLYTMREVAVGDKATGNWYRLYYDGRIYVDAEHYNEYYFTIEQNYDDEIADRLINGKYLIGVDGESSIVDLRFEIMKIYENDDEVYMDFYFSEGEYQFEDIISITSEALFTEGTTNLYQLIPN